MEMEAPQKETILSAAVAKGIELLPINEVNEGIVELHRQVSDLESTNSTRKQVIKILHNRNAALWDAIRAISTHCSWRQMGFCDLLCSGRAFCKTEGLAALPLSPENEEVSSQ